MGRPFKCPCGAKESVAKGYRRTKTMGLRRVRLCKVCGKKFTPRNQKPVEREPDTTPMPADVEQSDMAPKEESSPDDQHHQPGVQAD